MGKPNPAKLANFPELEVFVMLADPQGLVLDSKEYLAPIVTPHEALLAFTGQGLDAARYRLDFGDLLHLHQQQEQAAAGSARGTASGVGEDGEGEGAGVSRPHGQQLAAACGSVRFGDGSGLAAGVGALVIAGSSQTAVLGAGSRTGQQVQVQSAAQYLTQQRTYKGLETPATGGEIKAAELAVEGRSGRAAAYADEPGR